VTNKSADTLTVTRAQESTSASNKNTSGSTYSLVLGIMAKMITDIAATMGGGTPTAAPTSLARSAATSSFM
jgi:hypothetical protein